MEGPGPPGSAALGTGAGGGGTRGCGAPMSAAVAFARVDSHLFLAREHVLSALARFLEISLVEVGPGAADLCRWC